MQFDKKVGLIRKLLKKKHEAPIIELQIKDYNNSNFYISLLYSRTIDKFKVLYIPLDVVEDNKIEEYCCYQFMEVKSTIYITEQIKKELPKYEELVSRDNRNKHINNFIIEIDVYMNKKKYDFYTTRYLPKRWEFLFEAIVMLFEHCPNIMNELATEILSVIMNTNESIEYQTSLNCDLDTMDLKNYFPVLQDEKELKEKKIDYLEYVNGKYYAVVEDHLIIIEYNNNRKILNIFCDQAELVYSNSTYQVLKAIKNKQEERFYKIKYIDEEDKKYNYLCLSINKDGLKVIKHNEIVTLPMSTLKDKDVKILEDKNNILKRELEKVMKS